MAQNPQIEIGSYHDPAWDYAVLWDFLHKAGADLKGLIRYSAEIENATPQSDRFFNIQLEAIAASIAQALKTIKRP